MANERCNWSLDRDGKKEESSRLMEGARLGLMRGIRGLGSTRMGRKVRGEEVGGILSAQEEVGGTTKSRAVGGMGPDEKQYCRK